MHVYGKLIIDVSLFVNTENPEEAVIEAIDQVNTYNIDAAQLLEILNKLKKHNVEIEWEDIVA